MEKLFVPYSIALKLKEKGFDEACFARIHADGFTTLIQPHWKNSDVRGKYTTVCAAPTYQQVVDWFRETHDLVVEHRFNGNGRFFYSILKLKEKVVVDIDVSKRTFNDYYKALTKAIEQALTLI